MRYFVIVFNRLTRELAIEEFEASARALERRFALERELGSASDVEIALLGSESRQMLRRTHARYFHDSGEIAAQGATLLAPRRRRTRKPAHPVAS